MQRHLHTWVLWLAAWPLVSKTQTLERALRTEELSAMHRILDSDRDGLVSLDEGLVYARTHRKAVSAVGVSQILTNMDSDKDGRLSIQEFVDDLVHWKLEEDAKEEMKESVESTFSAYDADQDGLLDAEELPIFYAWLLDFRKADKNGDGALSLKEFRKAAAKSTSQSPGQSKASGKQSSEDKEVFGGLDANGDKRLSVEEYWAFKSGTFAAEQALRTLFRIADADQDERLSTEELAEARQKMGGSSAYYHMRDWARHEGVMQKDEL